MTPDERLYQIAVTFPALLRKGVDHGDIPGITETEINDAELAEYLYQGHGRALSSGEFVLLEFLLNLHSPNTHTRFNLGAALSILDPTHMNALIKATARVYTNS